MAAERRKCLGTLGLRDGASEEEIRKAYKKLALQYHPDKNESDDAKGKFQEIGYAYKYLTDGPSAFGTTDPHDVREEMLRRMFEEMFFARFRGPFGGFPFFCEESDDDDYYMYYDSSDNDCYCGNCDKKGSRSKGRQSYQNTYPRQPAPPPNYPPPSKKQMRKREKRQRQKERAKERKDADKKETKVTRNVYTDDVNTESKEKESKMKHSTGEDNSSTKSEDKTDTGSSRPDTPVMNQQSQKPNKKQKKKMESEQRKREKEMEEIAIELKKKQEREMEKQKEKERLAAQKKEEEKENEINFSHFFDNGKKSRKARQREKKRQESGGYTKETAQHRDNSGSSVPSGKTLHNLNTNRNSSGDGKSKDKTGANIYKSHESKAYTKKSAMNGNRFDILDDIDDDMIRPLSRGSTSSSDSQNIQKPHSGQSRPTSGGVQSSGPSSRVAGFANPNSNNTNGLKSETYTTGFKDDAEINKQFKSRTFQNTNMNQNNSNSNGNAFGNFGANGASETKGNSGFEKDGNGIGKNINGVSTDRKKSPRVNRSLSDDMKSGFNEFDDGERQFVKDWSVYYSDEEDNLDHLHSGYGAPQFVDNQNSSQYYGYGPKSGNDNFGYGYDGSYRRPDPYQPQGYPRRPEFIPRTRGYHGPDFRPYFGGPPGFPTYMRGPPSFARGMYPPPPPHFRGGYQARPPPPVRNRGYHGPRYGPPMGMPGYGYGQQFDGSIPYGVPFHGREQNVPDDMKRNINRQGNKPKQFSPKKSFKNNLNNVQNANSESVSSEARPNVQASTNTSASGMRVPSPEFSSQQNKNVPGSQFTKNLFSNLENNQAGSGGSLDSLDDFVLYDTGRASTDNQKLRETRPRTPPGRPSSGVDMGLDEFLSKDNLGVPAGLFNDSIKNYYK